MTNQFLVLERAKVTDALTTAEIEILNVLITRVREVDGHRTYSLTETTEPTPRFYVGQDVKIIRNTCGHGNKIGDIVTLVTARTVGDKMWTLKDTNGWMFDEDDAVPLREVF